MSELVEIARALRDLQKQVAALQRLEHGSGGGGGLDFDDIHGLGTTTLALADEFAIYDVDAAAAKKVTTQEVWDSLAELEDVSTFDTTDPIPLYSTNTGKTEKLPVWGVYYLISSLADNPTTIDPATDYFLLKSAGFNIYKVSVSDILDSIKTIDGSGSGLDADTVDGAHYAEGTWNPQLQFGGANVGMTQATAAGTYVKFGKAVFISLRITLSAKGSSTGAATVSGLPFSGPTGTFNRYIFPARVINGGAIDNMMLTFDGANATALQVYNQNGGASGNITDTVINDNTTIHSSGWYMSV